MATDRRSTALRHVHTLFNVGELRLVPGLPREIAQTMTGWEPIPGLLG